MNKPWVCTFLPYYFKHNVIRSYCAWRQSQSCPTPILKAMGNWESSLINRCILCLFKENWVYLSSFLHIIQSTCFKGNHVPQFILLNEISTAHSSIPLTRPMSCMHSDLWIGTEKRERIKFHKCLGFRRATEVLKSSLDFIFFLTEFLQEQTTGGSKYPEALRIMLNLRTKDFGGCSLTEMPIFNMRHIVISLL